MPNWELIKDALLAKAQCEQVIGQTHYHLQLLSAPVAPFTVLRTSAPGAFFEVGVSETGLPTLGDLPDGDLHFRAAATTFDMSVLPWPRTPPAITYYPVKTLAAPPPPVIETEAAVLNVGWSRPLEFLTWVKSDNPRDTFTMPRTLVTIFKSKGGRDTGHMFSNTYLFESVDLYNSDNALATVGRLVNAEQHIYFTDTEFMSARLVGVDYKGKQIENQSRTVPLEKTGIFVMPVGAKYANSLVCYGVNKMASNGKAGVTKYRYCLTSAEEDLWRRTRALPARFTTVASIDGGVDAHFLGALAAVSTNVWKMVLPEKWNKDGSHTQRIITSFLNGGLVNDQPKRPKASAEVNMRLSTQQMVNELGRQVYQLRGGSDDGQIPADSLLTASKIKREVLDLIDQLPLAQRAKVKMPQSLVGVVAFALPV